MAIEDTACFHGRYHPWGLISPIDGIGPADLNIDSLIERIDGGRYEELIMTISPTIEGDHFLLHFKKLGARNRRELLPSRGVFHLAANSNTLMNSPHTIINARIPIRWVVTMPSLSIVIVQYSVKSTFCQIASIQLKICDPWLWSGNNY